MPGRAAWLPWSVCTQVSATSDTQHLFLGLPLLQELLEFTMMTQSHLVGDDELFGDDPSADAWSLPPPSHASTLGDASPRSIGGLPGADSAMQCRCNGSVRRMGLLCLLHSWHAFSQRQLGLMPAPPPPGQVLQSLYAVQVVPSW